ncbi:uncharacterized protein LAJ45_10268 [Morchella importuna]|uniref:uncharacterized protein n=1 Tax=Morchella importuna TaxID=1174673 RepID=UPI001E8E9467|nr:uncharacterized protein LAJ45_10268 [Morchella importuna]KAH8145628.1 hypothetical protein LAJ45_10268 [Morchella importuna]
MPYNLLTPTDLEALTLRHPLPDSTIWTWNDPDPVPVPARPPTPPSPTGPTGTDTPWWPSWDPPSPAPPPRPHSHPRRAEHTQQQDRALTIFSLLLGQSPRRGGRAAGGTGGDAAGDGAAAGAAGGGAGGGDGERVWAGVDAALTALVVLGCGGARVGAVGVGACVVCYARVADVVLRPCGHLVLCSGCVLVEKVGGKGAGAGKRRQAVCPVPECGRAVEETLKTYRG